MIKSHVLHVTNGFVYSAKNNITDSVCDDVFEKIDIAI